MRGNSRLERCRPKPETHRVRWKKITLVGVGLVGGSLGMALRQRRLAKSVVGFVRRAASVTGCKKQGAVDLATRDLGRAVEGADLIVLCTPIAQMRGLVEQMLPALDVGVIVTDVGSVKGSVVRELEPLLERVGASFVGSHPMAGAERTGVSAAQADLFRGAVCVVTPTKRTNPAALRSVQRLWRAVGGRVTEVSPELHDALVSRSSHLPHLVAVALASSVLDPHRPKSLSQLCANGFRDTTRIASGSPEMWRDIALANRKHLRVALDEFVRELQRLQTMLRRGRAAEISRLFETAKRQRDAWCVRHASPE